jgi:hypothetical protein
MKAVNRESIGLVYTGYTIADSKLNAISEVTPKIRGWVLPYFAKAKEAVVPAGESSALIRKDCFKKIGLFDSQLSISSGYDLYRRIAQHYEIEFVQKSLIYYRQHQQNASKHLEIYEHDVFIVLEKMFSDPESASIFPMRRICYGRTHLSLSGGYLSSGKILRSLWHLFRGLLFAPEEFFYVLFYPVRKFNRIRAS